MDQQENSKLLEAARCLNAVETICVKKELSKKLTSQPFSYLLVLDFEATCWSKEDDFKAPNEVIECPCVLYHVETNRIVSEFQLYVRPVENPILSEFCMKLTGIRQSQVDGGFPLDVSLMLFKKWLEEMRKRFALSYDIYSSAENKCIFATWSDWDLGVCLKRESQRKRITLPEMFTTWIDVRAIYCSHYLRKPKGLYGALQELGLEFVGREHCGLDDARNTAKLIGAMLADGVLLERTPSF
ncbi:snipper [Leptinotarsa decemlineata]|uniref:snipper n=1 Tax=Leptinotarsa decemlineata TaxID=7539 RepID=UPI000C2558C3|nr:ERI1 exoribonuclease 2 [Leptinotarsa decemlineata]